MLRAIIALAKLISRWVENSVCPRAQNTNSQTQHYPTPKPVSDFLKADAVAHRVRVGVAQCFPMLLAEVPAIPASREKLVQRSKPRDGVALTLPFVIESEYALPCFSKGDCVTRNKATPSLRSSIANLPW